MDDKLEEVLKVLHENNVSARDLKHYLEEAVKTDADKELRQKVEANRYLEGKCFVCTTEVDPMFPPMKRYLKVISAQACTEYRVSVLTFPEHPFYWFDYKSSKIGNAGDYFLGNFDFTGIEVTDIMIDNLFTPSLKNFSEISLDEYNEALLQFTKELIELPWTADHYRFGNKLPTDPEWFTHPF